MQALKSLLIAASLVAAGAAFADSSVVNMDTVSQTQGGARNNQNLELGTVHGGLLGGGGTARVTATNISQYQNATDSTQEMVLGKIDKGGLSFGSNSTTVTANRVSQYQTGNHNQQHMKAGVIE